MSCELLADKVAIVTGAATGTGRALARKLAAEGAAVVVDHLHQPEQAITHFGQIDSLVNNAAVAPIKPIVEVTESDMDAVLAVNVEGTLNACQVAAEHLPSRGGQQTGQ